MKRGHELARSFHAAGENRVPFPPGPKSDDAFASEMNHRIGGGQRPVAGRDFHAGRKAAARRARRVACQHSAFVAQPGEMRGERMPEKAGAAGYEDAHDAKRRIFPRSHW